MKNILLLFIVLTTAGNSMFAQVKIGYFDTQYAITQMPEFKQAEAELKVYGEQLKKEMEAKEIDIKTKTEAIQKDPKMLPEIRESKEKELQALYAGYQDFQQSAQRKIQEKEMKLMEPIYVKLQNAINDVAKTNAYAFILKKESLLFELPENNISDMVLKKMGITPVPPNTNKPKQ